MLRAGWKLEFHKSVLGDGCQIVLYSAVGVRQLCTWLLVLCSSVLGGWCLTGLLELAYIFSWYYYSHTFDQYVFCFSWVVIVGWDCLGLRLSCLLVILLYVFPIFCIPFSFHHGMFHLCLCLWGWEVFPLGLLFCPRRWSLLLLF